MLERDFQRWVIEVARALGWQVYHVPAPMQWDSSGRGRGFVGARDAAGLPDLILVGKTKVIFAEVKGTKGKPSDKQVSFVDSVNALRSRTVTAYLWWPGDEDEIEEVLKSDRSISR